MRVRPFILILLAGVVAFGGCRTNRNLALLEQELRMQEDHIYELRDCLQEARAALEASTAENEALRRSLGKEQGTVSETSRDRGPTRSTGLDIEMPSNEETSKSVPSWFRRPPAKQDPGTTLPLPGGLNVSPGVEVPPPTDAPPADAPPAEQIPMGESRAEPSGPEIDPTGRSEQAAQIEVGAMAIEPIGEAPSEEGLSLVVMPRDSRGGLLPAPAPVSIVVVDPALSGPAARVGRWDFSAEEMSRLYESSGAADGFRLRLKWPDGGPAHKELHMFVRYETADGRKLEAEAPFDLGRLAVAPRPQSPSAAGWQRKIETARTQQREPRVANRSDWSTNDRPAWNGGAADTSRRDEQPGRSTTRVTSRPRAPEWSPERK